MKKLFVILFLLCGIACLAQSSGKQVKHKVVIQMSSADTLVHKSLFNQLNALNEAWGDDAAIEVLLHGPGVDMVVRERIAPLKSISRARENGVRFIVCENTLKQRRIEKEMLIGDLDYVPYGLVHLIMRQEEGWSYIKAGF